MTAGMMLPSRNMQSMIGRSSNGALAFGSSPPLSIGQANMLEAQQIPMRYHDSHEHEHEHQQLHPADMSESLPLGPSCELGPHGTIRSRDQDHEFELSKSMNSENNGEGGASGDDIQDPNQRPKKKRYHRHTQHQIRELEAFFKECPHPDDKQRKALSQELGLEPLQIKFWFQNKRTQMKTQHERSENSQLRSENEKLRAENMRYKEALTNASCPNCGGPASLALGEMSFDEHHLRIENARLREEIDRISAIAAKYVGKPLVPYQQQQQQPQSSPIGSFEMFGPSDQLLLRSVTTLTGQQTSDADKPLIIELAVTAMEEMVRMAQLNDPLWLQPGSNASTDQILNEDEYLRLFPRGIGPKPLGMSSEASRHTAVVIMNHANLVEILMDVNQWCSVFSSIVSRAVTLEVLSTGVAGNYNGAFQVMSAEFQVPSPLVPTRESLFVRYCKQHQDGTWAVVDVSLDGLRAGPTTTVRSRRRPSGCLIQEMPNGYSKVTWVEHVEADDRAVHNLYKPLVNCGLAFGAKRWVGTLERQCERLASVMASNIPNGGDIGVITTAEGKKSMLKLAERMVGSFCGGVTASTTHQWTTLSGSGAEDVRVMTRKSVDDPGRPPGIILNAATSFWLPVPPKRVFDFLRDESTRSEWDILSNGGVVQEMAHIANGRDHGNCVSLLRVNSTNANQSNMLILQESCTDLTGSYVIYAPVDVVAMNVVLNGGDPDYVALLPSGFAILPDGPQSRSLGQHDHDHDQEGPTPNEVPVALGESTSGTNGSLLTVAFQILVDSVPTAKLSLGSVATVNSLIACTVERIKAAVSLPNAPPR